MNNIYLAEAFKSLSMLNEEDFELNKEGTEEMEKFINDEEESPVQLIDPEATKEDELEDSYVGKAILDCVVCHSKIYKDPSEITLSDDGDVVNFGEECPYCYSADGFKVLGQVAPFTEEEIKVEVEEKEDSDEDEVEVESEEEVETESLKENEGVEECLKEDQEDICPECDKNPCECPESCNEELSDKPIKITRANIDKYYNNPDGSIYYHFDDEQDGGVYDILIDFSIEDIRQGMKNGGKFYFHKGNEPHLTINEDVKHTKTLVDDEGTEVTVEGNTEQEATQKATQLNQRLGNKMKVVEGKVQESIENMEVETEHEVIRISSEDKPEEGEEAIEPVSTELEDQIAVNTTIAKADEAEANTDTEFEDVDIEHFDEESFDNFGESYLKKIYSNVESYKTSEVINKGNQLIVEGVIAFSSGNEKKTSFVFEAKDMTRKGKLRFTGFNEGLSSFKKAFTITGSLKDNTFLTESFNYNYKAKDSNGKLTRLYGTLN